MFFCRLGDPRAETISLGSGLVSYRGIRLCAIQGRGTLGGCFAQELVKKMQLWGKASGILAFLTAEFRNYFLFSFILMVLPSIFRVF